MEPEETHNRKIEELLSAAFDGEVSEEEHAQAEEALNSPEWVSHAAFLSILKDSARFDPVEVPASLSERIALATYARPTLWSRIVSALRPAPVRYAAGGLVLSGLAAIGLVMFRPAPATRVPAPAVTTAPAPNQLAKDTTNPVMPETTPELVVKPSPAPTPEVIEPTPAPPVPVMPAVSNSTEKTTSIPATKSVNDSRRPLVTPTEVTGHEAKNSHVSITPKASPAPTVPTRKPTPLPPPRLADPITGPVTVAQESVQPDAVNTGETKGLTEGTSVVAEPRSVTIASANAAAMRDPAENPQVTSSNPDAVVKISLNQGREKLNGLSARAGIISASGSRMPVVTDNEKR